MGRTYIHTAVVAGGVKGFSDGAGIDMSSFDYILPIGGSLAYPMAAGVEELFNYNQGRRESPLLGPLLTGASYLIGGAIGRLTQHFS